MFKFKRNKNKNTNLSINDKVSINLTNDIIIDNLKIKDINNDDKYIVVEVKFPFNMVEKFEEEINILT